MWTGGVRVVIPDGDNRILMVKQSHPERDVWMVPGGRIEADENAEQAAVREVLEETGLNVKIVGLLWHVEEVSERGQRFVNIFLAKPIEGRLHLGTDPELANDAQILREVKFMTRDEVAQTENLYPEFLRDEFWQKLTAGELEYNAFKVRD